MWSKNKLWNIAPASLMMIVLFLGGLVIGFLQSLGFFSYEESSKISLEAYKHVWFSSEFWYSLLYSLRISLIATVCSSFLGLSLLLILYRIALQNRWPVFHYWRLLIQLPFFIPHVVAAYLVTLFFLQSGWVSRGFYYLGWIDKPEQFPILVHDPFGWGIILTYVWKETPFIFLMLFPVLSRIHSDWFSVARLHGANLSRFIYNVIVPLLLPPLVIVSFIVFSFIFSAYEVPALLGVTYPKFLSVYGIELYQSINWTERQAGLVVHLSIAWITIGIGIFAYRWTRKWRAMSNKGW
jgi:putative spermidine/putrescine transport system permease protein